MKGTAVSRAPLLLLLAGACSAAPPAPMATVAPPPSASVSAPVPPAVDPGIVGVVAARPPAQSAIDGDLAEWGAFPVPQPSAPRPADEDEPKDPLPNPPEAASRLAVAVTGEALLIAAELGEAARDGIWLGIGATPPGVPALGQPAGRAGFLPLQCEFEVTCWEAGENNDATACGPAPDKPNPPEVVAECQRLIARHAELVVQHENRFHKLFKIDRGGVREVGAQGELGAVPGSRHGWKAGAKGATVEVALPLAALPRVAEAPLEALTLLARAATAAAPSPPDLPAARWVRVVLPREITFEPHGALRARAFAPQRERDQKPPTSMNMTTYEQPLGMSYQPGDPLHVEAMGDGYATTEGTPSDHLLYEKRASLGDVEVGSVDLCDRRERIGISKGGHLLDVVALAGTFQGAVTRDGEIHALAHGVPAWSGVAVGPDGKHREVVAKIALDADRPRPREASYWHDVSSFAGPELDTFGFRGAKGRRGVEVTWRWSRPRRMYTATERAIPPPAKAPRKTPKK